MMVIAMMLLLVVLNRIRNQYQNNVALRYQYKFEALSDQLHWEAIEGHIDGKGEAAALLECLLKTVQENLPSLSLWTLLGDQLVSVSRKENPEFEMKLEMIMADPGCRKIYLEANALWLENLKARHSYSIWTLTQMMVPVNGLAQLCFGLATLKERKRIRSGILPQIKIV